jgi:tetratricopeptide (TPR) repeat protein
MCLRWLGLWLLVGLMGCSSMLGRYYLASEQYEDGVRRFDQEVRAHPDDPAANYYLGRLYLAQENPEQALPFLRRAVELEPDKPDYHFWQGVGCWAVMDFEGERSSYQRALELDPTYIPARLYLGHNLLDSGQWESALTQYQEVLAQDPRNPEALYNQGLALRNLKRFAEEAQAWKEYLKYYPEGRWALQAVDHLNGLGDFSYRNFTIGYRRVTLEQIPFASGSAKLLSTGKPSLQVIGSILAVNQGIDLEIVGYKTNDAVLAAARAAAVRSYLVEQFPAIQPSRLKTRGESRPEAIETEKGVYHLDESTAFITVKK